MKTTTIIALAVIIALSAGCGGGKEKETKETIADLPDLLPRSMDFHIFYYAWFGNPEFDGGYRGWNHPVIEPDGSESGVSYPGGDDIASNFYPWKGCYSSNDPETVARHCLEIRLAGVGVICVSWWGEGSFSDRAVPLILDTAGRYVLKVDFQIEPF